MATSRGRGSDDPRAHADWTGPRPLVSGTPVVIGIVIIALVTMTIVMTLRSKPALPAALSAAYTSLMAGTLTPDHRVSDPDALATALRDAGAGFTPRIVPLLPDFELLGGRLHDVHGRTGAAWIYRAPNMDHALALAFRGTLDDLGTPDDIRSDPPPPLRIYRKMTQTIVCWQEGELVYAVVSTLPAERVVALARRLATPADRSRTSR